MARQPKLTDVVILDEKKYVIRAMIVADESIVLTLVGGPNSRVFVLRAHLRWQAALHAWQPVSIQDFFETHEPTSDQQRQ